MYVSHLVSLCLLICLKQGNGATNSSDQKNSFIDLRTNRTVNIKESCKAVSCLVKCCPMNQILLSNVTEDDSYISPICINNPEEYGIKSPFDYSNSSDIYNKDIKKKFVKTKKKLTNFTFIFSEKFLDMDCCMNFVGIFQEPKFYNYLTEDGRLLTKRFNHVDNWPFEINTEDFCFENEILVFSNGTAQSTTPELALYVISSDSSDVIYRRAKVSAYGMLVPCLFMLMVLVVYGLLKELRNLAGMVLMAYVATLTVAFLVKAIQVFANDSGTMDLNQCIGVGLLFLYTLFASFTWMNVMSFDIWLSMRGFRKCREIHRRGVPVKFAWYCLYAWGVPLIPTLFIVIVDHIDLTHLPNFVKPNFIVDPDECFLSEDERQLYLNAPIGIATSVNIVLFVMTAYNIWRIKDGVPRNAESSKNNKDEFRFILYLKLFVIMGVSRVIEVASFLPFEYPLLYLVTDANNQLIGASFFLIFICKKKIYEKLRNRLFQPTV